LMMIDDWWWWWWWWWLIVMMMIDDDNFYFTRPTTACFPCTIWNRAQPTSSGYWRCTNVATSLEHKHQIPSPLLHVSSASTFPVCTNLNKFEQVKTSLNYFSHNYLTHRDCIKNKLIAFF
jgi:hypothetical protein